MDINVAAAARRLGMTEPSVRSMIAAGRIPRQSATGPVLVAEEDVDRVRDQRRREALSRNPDLTEYARTIRRVLHPMADLADDTVELYDGRVQDRHTVPSAFAGVVSGPKALPFLSPDAAAVFGADVLTAAAAPAKSFAHACRWCFADMSARVHESFRPEDSAAYRVLLGEPCARDRERFASEARAARAQSEALRARLDRQTAAQRKADARTEHEAAQHAATLAARRLRDATEALVRTDPSAAVTAAATAPRPSRITCPCTAEMLCADHARRLAPRGRR